MPHKNNIKWFSLRVWLPLIVALGFFGAYSSCGSGEEFNLFQPIAEPLAQKNDAAQIEEAKVLIDQGEYGDAIDVLEKLVNDAGRDSNPARLLYAAAMLGKAELDIWSIITKILDGSATTGDSSGLDGVLDAFGETFLGTGTERDEKTRSLSVALTSLRDAPYPDERQVANTACLFAGMLAVPTLADAEEALSATLTALEQIRASASSGGTVCPDIDTLSDSTLALAEASEKFSEILDAAIACPFLDLSETQALMNTVELQMKNLTDNVDKGCNLDVLECPPGFPSCQSLFPVCVQQVLDLENNTAASGDGQIAACELVLNCTDPTACFGS